MKTCLRCGDAKLADDKNFRPGRNTCRKCESDYTKQYNKTNPEQHKAAADKWHKANPEHLMLLACRRRARDRSLPCTITKEDIRIPATCPICECSLTRAGKDRDASPSVDMWNLHLGYISGNIWVICLGCNRRKNDIPGDELIAFAFKAVSAFKEYRDGVA